MIDAFFNKKLKNAVVTDKHFEVVEKYCEPECIKLSTNANNSASISLADKLGFLYEKTDYHYKETDGVAQDEKYYYLDLERYLKLH